MAAEHACKAGYRNHILAALPTEEIELLRPHLSQITIFAGQVLHEANSPIAEVFFIENGVISLTADTRDLGRVAVGLLGREGSCGGVRAPRRKPVDKPSSLIPGSGRRCRMSSEALRSAVEQSQSLESGVCATLRC